MTALVYRVSCGSRGDLWFADGVEAEAAAQEILRGGEAVSLFPVPVPETAREFVAFMEYQGKPRSLSAATAEALKHRFGLLARRREAPSAELQVVAAILGVFAEKRLQEHEILAALEAVRCDTAETRAAVSRTFGRS